MGECADCPDVVMHVYDFIDDELPPEECGTIQEHLEVCSTCALLYRREQMIKALVARSARAVSAPPTLPQAVHARLEQVVMEFDDGTVVSQTQFQMTVGGRRLGDNDSDSAPRRLGDGR